MPVIFDEEWEYYQPDPEIEEIVAEEQDRFRLNDYRAEVVCNNGLTTIIELRKGSRKVRKSPSMMALASELYSKSHNIPEVAEKLGISEPTLYHWLSLSNTPRRTYKTLDMRKCILCPNLFKPCRQSTKYCSYKCAGIGRSKSRRASNGTSS